MQTLPAPKRALGREDDAWHTRYTPNATICSCATVAHG